MFSVHTTPEEFKEAIATGYFGTVLFAESSVRKSHAYCDPIVLEKLHLYNVLPVHTKWKASVFKSLRFDERFRTALTDSVDVRPNRWNYLRFSNFSGLAWALPYTCLCIFILPWLREHDTIKRSNPTFDRTFYTTIELHPHRQPRLPRDWSKTDVAGCDWWV